MTVKELALQFVAYFAAGGRVRLNLSAPYAPGNPGSISLIPIDMIPEAPPFPLRSSAVRQLILSAQNDFLVLSTPGELSPRSDQNHMIVVPVALGTVPDADDQQIALMIQGLWLLAFGPALGAAACIAAMGPVGGGPNFERTVTISTLSGVELSASTFGVPELQGSSRESVPWTSVGVPPPSIPDLHASFGWVANGVDPQNVAIPNPEGRSILQIDIIRDDSLGTLSPFIYYGALGTTVEYGASAAVLGFDVQPGLASVNVSGGFNAIPNSFSAVAHFGPPLV